MVHLTPERSKDPNVLLWKAEVKEYPAGLQNLKVSVMPIGGEELIRRRIQVDMPELEDHWAQGALWEPFSFTRGKVWVSERQANVSHLLDVPDSTEWQIFEVECSRPCKFRDFTFGKLGEDTPTIKSMTPKDDKTIRLTFSLENFPKIKWLQVQALLTVKDVSTDRYHEQLVKFMPGRVGAYKVTFVTFLPDLTESTDSSDVLLPRPLI